MTSLASCDLFTITSFNRTAVCMRRTLVDCLQNVTSWFLQQYFTFQTILTTVTGTIFETINWGSISGSVKLGTCRQWLATAATFLRSCCQALNRRDGRRHSLHASAKYREYNENFFLTASVGNNVNYILGMAQVNPFK